jgi:hypothetical protein
VNTAPALLLAAMKGRIRIPDNSVRLSSLPKFFYEFHKCPANNPGLLNLDHFLTVNTRFWEISSQPFPYNEYDLLPFYKLADIVSQVILSIHTNSISRDSPFKKPTKKGVKCFPENKRGRKYLP